MNVRASLFILIVEGVHFPDGETRTTQNVLIRRCERALEGQLNSLTET